MNAVRLLLAAAILAAIGLALTPARRAGIAAATPPVAVAPEQPAIAPVRNAREQAVAAELLARVVSTKGSQARLKAYYDAIRALGPAALPALLEAMKSEDPEIAAAALNAMGGLRHAARSLPGLLAEGKSVEEIAARLGLPVAAVQAWINHGPWSPDATVAMGDAAWSLYSRSASLEGKSDAVASLYAVSDESPAASARLVDAARAAADPKLRDRALAFAAGAEAASPLARLAADPGATTELRTRAALACLEAVKDRPDAPERALISAALAATAGRDMGDATLPESRRAAAAELHGRLGGGGALLALLRSGEPESLRCAVLKTLFETRGFEAARNRIEELANEVADSPAKDLARRLLKLNPAGAEPARR